MRTGGGLALGATLLLAACAGPHPRAGFPATGEAPAPAKPRAPVPDTPVKIGPPYQVKGIWYVPADSLGYDEVGYASWYGPGFHAGATANGERYDQEGVSAAHKTLPLPCYVEVTALDTGRTILVRINDRGPFVSGRIIDLSHGAARQLGIDRAGVARVRVRRVDPPAGDRLALRQGLPAPMRRPASLTELANLRVRLASQLAAAAPIQPRPAAVIPEAPHRLASVEAAIAAAQEEGDVPAGGAFFVQVAAAADRVRAEMLAGALSGFGAVQLVPGSPVRVRLGPYADRPSAEAVLAQLERRGYGGARLVQDAGQPITVTTPDPTQ